MTKKALVFEVPIEFKKRGSHRVIIAPDISANQSTVREPDPNMLKALIRAYKWQKSIESGGCRNIEELAAKENITVSYACRILRLTSLAPDIQKAILDGTQPRMLKLIELLNFFPLEWPEQRIRFGFQPFP